MTLTINLGTRIARLLFGLILMSIGGVATMLVSALNAGAVVEDAAYTAVTPCVAFDSRTNQGATGIHAGPYKGDKNGGVFTGLNVKTMQITGTFPAGQGGGNTDCNIPAGAAAVHINIVAVNPITEGNINVVDAGGAPLGGIVNYQASTPQLNIANAHTVPLSTTGQLDVFANCGANCNLDTVDVRGVVIGYYNDDLAARVDQLEALLAGVSRGTTGPNGSDTLTFSGMNIQLTDGTGSTECADPTCSGLGNLIIGYNEVGFDPVNRTGAHGLVVGTENDWTGNSNVVFGRANTATGNYSSVTGGVAGTASGENSSISGGLGNNTSGDFSSVTGGEQNTATGYYSSVNGGYANLAGGDYSIVSGGYANAANSTDSVMVGGAGNSTNGNRSVVVGGGSQSVDFDPLVVQADINANHADGVLSVVVGGGGNDATGVRSVVTGGSANLASGSASVVSGGASGIAPNDFNWVAGALFQPS